MSYRAILNLYYNYLCEKVKPKETFRVGGKIVTALHNDNDIFNFRCGIKFHDVIGIVVCYLRVNEIRCLVPSIRIKVFHRVVTFWRKNVNKDILITLGYPRLQ